MFIIASPNPQRQIGAGDSTVEDAWNDAQTYREFLSRVEVIAERNQKWFEENQPQTNERAESKTPTNPPVIKKTKDEKKEEKIRKRDRKEKEAVEKFGALPPGRLEPGTFNLSKKPGERPPQPLVPGPLPSSSSSSHALPKARSDS